MPASDDDVNGEASLWAVDTLADQRRRARMVRDLLGDEVSPEVRAAMAQAPRHLFAPPEASAQVYDDHPVAIGGGQTLSQPRVVAHMLDQLMPLAGCRVLDVGSGSGYVTALLAVLAGSGAEVKALERREDLVQRSLRSLSLWPAQTAAAWSVRVADGGLGAPDDAPFDRIHVACVAEQIPPGLIDQLAPGGRLIMPIGSDEGHQHLEVIVKAPDGRLCQYRSWAVRFVPMLPGMETGG